MQRPWMCALVALALLGATACIGGGGGDDVPSASEASGGQFGGELEGTDALIGIVVGKERVTVYACDDGTISEWFISDAAAASLTLVSAGGAVATLKLGDDAVTGSIIFADGSEHEFRATPQAEPVIHRAEAATEDGDALAGWVTVGDRTTGSLSGTVPGSAPKTTAAPALPAKVTLVPLPVAGVTVATALVTITGDASFVTGNRPMTFVVGGVGDSYASGEGNPVNRPDTPTGRPSPKRLSTMWGPKFGMNGCHRSDDAATPRAFQALTTKYQGFDMKLVFVACGGSHVTHVTGRLPGQAPGATGLVWGPGLRGDAVGERTDRWDAIAEPAQLLQLDNGVRAIAPVLPVDVLTMSIGGNDSGFATVIGACVMGGTPSNVDGIDPEATVIGIRDPLECDANPALAAALDNDGPPAGSPFAVTVPGWNEILRRYDALDATLEAFSTRVRPIGQVLITQYGAGLKNTDGSAYCGGRSANTKDDITGFIDTDETNWIDGNLLGPLNTTVERAATAANANGQGPNWKLISSHVPVFRNHGPCSAEPWTNINNTALAAQGNNLPDKPDDGSREGLAQLNTALATAKGGAIGCGIGLMAIFFSAAGCAAGAGGGLIVGLATNEAESAVSAGVSHPNKRGWQAIGEAIFPELDAAFKRTFTPLPPNRTRQFGARVNGDIIVRWDDRSSVETRYEVEIFSLTNPTTPVVRETNLPTNSVEYTYKAGQAFVGFARARACNSAFCSPFSAKVKITNMKSGVPTGLSALTYGNQTLAADLPDTLVVLATDPRNADTTTRIELTQLTDANSAVLPVRSSNTKVFNVPAPFPSVFTFGGATGIPKGLYRVRAASCNLLGCSEFSTTTDSRAAPPGAPNLKIAELPPFVVDGLGLTRPRVRGGLPPEPGSGVPSPTLPSPRPSTTLR